MQITYRGRHEGPMYKGVRVNAMRRTELRQVCAELGIEPAEDTAVWMADAVVRHLEAQARAEAQRRENENA